jgi:hypothetical protein
MDVCEDFCLSSSSFFSLSLSFFLAGGGGGVPVRAGLLVDSESVLVPMQCAVV